MRNFLAERLRFPDQRFYNLPTSLCKKIFLSDVRFFVKGKDLFMTDHVKIMDPESVSYTHLDVYKRQGIFLIVSFLKTILMQMES